MFNTLTCCIINTLLLISALTLSTKTYATPVEVKIADFNDNWNYQRKPDGMPLLARTSRNHMLPPESNVTDVEVKDVDGAKRQGKKLGDAVQGLVPCPYCKLGVGLFLKEVQKNTSFEDVKKKFVHLCATLKIQTEIVCTGIFDTFGPDIFPVIHTIRLDAAEICALVLGEACGDVKIPAHEWTIELPDVAKPEVTEPEIPKPGLPTFKVLQISDTHYDPEYAVGSPSNCQEPFCCRNSSTPPKEEDIIPAGIWGSYKQCDSPKRLLDNMFSNIVKEHPDIDYIIWTGDLVPHNIWNQSKETSLDIIQDTVEQMFENFPNTPIFPAIGNHESVPAGNFPPPWVRHQDYSVSWLYRRIADHWRKWLPTGISMNSVLHGAFYSILLRPGFRIISLNTNYCHTLSWWLLVNSTDPAQELKWLVHELQEAENRGEKVHFIGHIPPGSSDCMKVWSRNFNAIVERYENTIAAQFYGHSHADEFEIFYDSQENSRPTGVAYLGPSVTTFRNFNPAYRIYYVDGDHENTTREVIDHETWTMDLEEANKSGDKEPQWYRLYSARKDYQMESLRPKIWARLIDRLIADENLFDLFYKNYYRNSPVRPDCDNKCKLQVLCDLKSGKSHNRHLLCHDLELTFGD